ncbi:DUF1804 family protein [Methylophilus aquaticus]|uniref:DUF1804 family protein n=1 Tax=Methylophilus aquaticus TaxID=1971610 RepID=A0ABT9JTN0_9PROT|nr:DUF1804 family protein [Methylophilus aquaticus]MDP8567915.1 DUF1804 family protein [Methylophilus aquaticus]
MAHSQETRNNVRKAFVVDGLPLTVACSTNGVSYDTGREWKRQAKEAGDDWDTARAAHQITNQSTDEATKQLVDIMVRKALVIAQKLEDSNLGPEQQIQLVASISDSMSKFTKCIARIDPKLGALSVALDTLKTIAEYLQKHDRVALAQFQDHLEGIGGVLQSRFG